MNIYLRLRRYSKYSLLLSRSAHPTTNFPNSEFHLSQFQVLQSVLAFNKNSYIGTFGCILMLIQNFYLDNGYSKSKQSKNSLSNSEFIIGCAMSWTRYFICNREWRKYNIIGDSNRLDCNLFLPALLEVLKFSQLSQQLPYARHYNPRFVYFLPTFWSTKTFFQWAFFLKFWPYVWLVFKSGF